MGVDAEAVSKCAWSRGLVGFLKEIPSGREGNKFITENTEDHPGFCGGTFWLEC